MTMKFKKCESCGQWIRNTKGKQKKEVIRELCKEMGWDALDWEWKIQNTSMNYDMLVDILNKIKGTDHGRK